MRARLLPEDAAPLPALAAAASRVHRSLPPGHPRRRDAAELSGRLRRLLLRGVPAEALGSLLGITHQGVRYRASLAPAPAPGAPSALMDALFADVSASPDMLLLSDTGSFRRVRAQSGAPVGYPLRPVPSLSSPELLAAWLESESPRGPHLRAVPAVLADPAVVRALLEPHRPRPDPQEDPR
jgi:hypothetical protein